MCLMHIPLMVSLVICIDAPTKVSKTSPLTLRLDHKFMFGLGDYPCLESDNKFSMQKL